MCQNLYVETYMVSADMFFGAFQNKIEKVNNTGQNTKEEYMKCGRASVGITFFYKR